MNQPLDQEKWRAWFAAHAPGLVLFARQYTSCHADAEDTVQTAFMRFWPQRNRVRDPRPYLYSAVRTVALDAYRSNKRRQSREILAGKESGAAWFECPTDRQDRVAELQEAVKSLPLEQRVVVVMKIWADLTFLEIGRALDISPNTAASRYRYALQALQKRLQNETL